MRKIASPNFASIPATASKTCIYNGMVRNSTVLAKQINTIYNYSSHLTAWSSLQQFPIVRL